MAWGIMAAISCLAIDVQAGEQEFPLSVARPRPLTVADCIATTRVVPASDISSIRTILSGPSRPSAVEISPAGDRYVLRLVRGDLERNGNWVEILSGSLESLETASNPVVVARLFTTSLEDSYEVTLNPLVWLGKNLVGFRWVRNGTSQVMSVDLLTCDVKSLTSSETDVANFGISPTGILLYKALRASDSSRTREMIAKGFAIKNLDIRSVLRGEIDSESSLDRLYCYEWWMQRPGKPAENINVPNRWLSIVAPQFSPDGRYAIAAGFPREIPSAWKAYRPPYPYSEILHSSLRSSWYGRQITQSFLVDLERGSAEPLISAPLFTGTEWAAAWSPDSRSVLLGPTFIPLPTTDEAGLTGQAIVEVEIANRKMRQIPIPMGPSSKGTTFRWLDSGSIEVRRSSERWGFYRDKTSWQSVGQWPRQGSEPPGFPIEITVREGMNLPPAVYARDTRSGEERLILNPNPKLVADFDIGKVDQVQWHDRGGRTWTGLLFYPLGSSEATRHPLVIQTHGHASPDQFSLYGIGPLAPGLGPGFSVFAARALAAKGIAVLQVADLAKKLPEISTTPAEGELYRQGYESAIVHLAKMGLIDETRVGLVGFSRSGWHVEYALTHSSFPYAAALTSDNISGSYVQNVLNGGGFFEDINGAEPFGTGIKSWLELAPGFNAEHVRTPIRLQIEGSLLKVLEKWELFSRLRQLGKPVELVAIPNIERGSHNIQNPRQCFFSQQGAVDWFDFWLNGAERKTPVGIAGETEEDLKQQYLRWRNLRELRDADRKTPPVPRLKWMAVPTVETVSDAEMHTGKETPYSSPRR